MDSFLYSLPTYYSLGSNLCFLPDSLIDCLKKELEGMTVLNIPKTQGKLVSFEADTSIKHIDLIILRIFSCSSFFTWIN